MATRGEERMGLQGRKGWGLEVKERMGTRGGGMMGT